MGVVFDEGFTRKPPALLSPHNKSFSNIIVATEGISERVVESSTRDGS